jgi:hypothetical protein
VLKISIEALAFKFFGEINEISYHPVSKKCYHFAQFKFRKVVTFFLDTRYRSTLKRDVLSAFTYFDMLKYKELEKPKNKRKNPKTHVLFLKNPFFPP